MPTNRVPMNLWGAHLNLQHMYVFLQISVRIFSIFRIVCFDFLDNYFNMMMREWLLFHERQVSELSFETVVRNHRQTCGPVDIFSWFMANQSFLILLIVACLAKNEWILILLFWVDPTGYWTPNGGHCLTRCYLSL